MANGRELVSLGCFPATFLWGRAEINDKIYVLDGDLNILSNAIATYEMVKINLEPIRRKFTDRQRYLIDLEFVRDKYICLKTITRQTDIRVNEGKMFIFLFCSLNVN